MRKSEREYRTFASLLSLPERAGEGGGGDEERESCLVRGRAIVFDRPTCLFEADGVRYFEVIDRRALDGCDLSDVIMNYNHEGKVVARIRNGTLRLIVTEEGLDVEALLSGTAEGRALYEEIKGGYIDKMSFSFIPAEESYDQATHTRRIHRIRKLYDVSAVDVPAYQETSISARRFFAEEYAKAAAGSQARRRKLLVIKTFL